MGLFSRSDRFNTSSLPLLFHVHHLIPRAFPPICVITQRKALPSVIPTIETFPYHVEPIIYQRHCYRVVRLKIRSYILCKVCESVYAYEPLMTPLKLSFSVSSTDFVLGGLLLVGGFDLDSTNFHATCEQSDILVHALGTLKPLTRCMKNWFTAGFNGIETRSWRTYLGGV